MLDFKQNKQTFFARALTSIFLATVHVLTSKKKINERLVHLAEYRFLEHREILLRNPNKCIHDKDYA
jgi:hypothetical protein